MKRAPVRAAHASLLVVAWMLAGCAGESSPQLPALKVDPDRVAVVGISSGAIMAQQVHLAFSDRIVGAVLLAGPPYGCAEGDLDTALSRCLVPREAAPDVEALAARVRERAASGKLAPLAGLAGDRVLVVHGDKDGVVAEPVAHAAHALYLALDAGVDSRWEGDGAFAHLWPTRDDGDGCDQSVSPYLGTCGRDFAADVFLTLYGPTTADVANEPAGQLLRFDQSRFAAQAGDPLLDGTGFLYQPPQCGEPGRCGLLIAFHGCEMQAASIGDAFVRGSGLNRWADLHGVVVLYPQTRSSYMPLNPKACWDWWGYSGGAYDTRDGAQLRWVAAVSAALGAPLK